MKVSGDVHTTVDAAPWKPVTHLLQFVPISLIAKRKKFIHASSWQVRSQHNKNIENFALENYQKEIFSVSIVPERKITRSFFSLFYFLCFGCEGQVLLAPLTFPQTPKGN